MFFSKDVPGGLSWSAAHLPYRKMLWQTCGESIPEVAIKLTLTGWWLTYPSEKWWSSSVGIMNFPIYEMENKSHVPNHQPVDIRFIKGLVFVSQIPLVAPPTTAPLPHWPTDPVAPALPSLHWPRALARSQPTLPRLRGYQHHGDHCTNPIGSMATVWEGTSLARHPIVIIPQSYFLRR